MFHVDLIIEKKNGVVDKQPETLDNTVDRNGGAIMLDGTTKETNVDMHDAQTLSDTEALVSRSVGDLPSMKLPNVKDMEIDILKGGTSSEYIVMDKLDDSRVLKLKAMSVELDIKVD